MSFAYGWCVRLVEAQEVEVRFLGGTRKPETWVRFPHGSGAKALSGPLVKLAKTPVLFGLLAPMQSNGLLPRWFWVQVPGNPPTHS